MAESPATDEQIKTFEGRPLAKQGEDPEDQGLGFDLGTLVNRRRALGLGGMGAGALLLAACGADSSSSSASSTSASASESASASASATASASAKNFSEEMPTETAGPYPGDGSNGPDILDETGVERSDLTKSIGSDTAVDGVPLTIKLNVYDILNDSKPYENAAVYLWHCDAQGNYSMYSDGYTEETWLRGVQVVDANGQIEFTSIVPGCYTGRWPHIHFEVFPDVDSITDSTNAVLTSQIVVPEDVANACYALDSYSGSAENLSQITLETDNVFSDGWDEQVPTVTGSVDAGYTLELDIPVDTENTPEVTVGGQTEGGAGAPGGDGGTPPEPPTGGVGGQPPAGAPSGMPQAPDADASAGATSDATSAATDQATDASSNS